MPMAFLKQGFENHRLKPVAIPRNRELTALKPIIFSAKITPPYLLKATTNIYEGNLKPKSYTSGIRIPKRFQYSVPFLF